MQKCELFHKLLFRVLKVVAKRFVFFLVSLKHKILLKKTQFFLFLAAEVMAAIMTKKQKVYCWSYKRFVIEEIFNIIVKFLFFI